MRRRNLEDKRQFMCLFWSMNLRWRRTAFFRWRLTKIIKKSFVGDRKSIRQWPTAWDCVFSEPKKKKEVGDKIWNRENDYMVRDEKNSRILNSFRNYQHLPFDFCSFRRCSAIFFCVHVAEREEHLEVYFIETIFSQGRGGTETCDDSSIGSCVRTRSVTGARATVYVRVGLYAKRMCIIVCEDTHALDVCRSTRCSTSKIYANKQSAAPQFAPAGQMHALPFFLAIGIPIYLLCSEKGSSAWGWSFAVAGTGWEVDSASITSEKGHLQISCRCQQLAVVALTEHLRVAETTLLRKYQQELSVSGRFPRSQGREIDDSTQDLDKVIAEWLGSSSLLLYWWVLVYCDGRTVMED